MLELAVSAAVMVSCLAGTFQFGYTFYIYNLLVTSIGNGARYASMRAYHAGSEATVEQDNRAIRNMVVYGDAEPGTGAAPIVPKLSPEQIDVKWILDDKGAPASVNVSIREYTVDAVFKSFRFAGRPTVEFPYIGAR